MNENLHESMLLRRYGTVLELKRYAYKAYIVSVVLLGSTSAIKLLFLNNSDWVTNIVMVFLGMCLMAGVFNGKLDKMIKELEAKIDQIQGKVPRAKARDKEIS